MSGQYCSDLNNSSAEGTSNFSGRRNSPGAISRSTSQGIGESGQAPMRQIGSGTYKVTPWDRAKLLFLPDSIRDRTQIRHKCGPKAFDVQDSSRSVEPHIRQ